jgi:DHA2 family multidrug resistance protein
LSSLTAFRVLQGFAGGPLMPLSQTLLFMIFPPKQRAMAMALWAITTLTAPILGPVLGGLLCDTFGWPAVFWVNVPIALICAPVLWRLLKPYEGETKKVKVDGVGLALLVVWVGALQLMLDLGKEHDWFESPMVIALAVTAVVGFAAFLIWELTEKNPIVDLRVFRHRGFSVSMITLALAFGAFFATNVMTPLWLQGQMGYTSTWAGYATGMVGVLAIVAAPVAAQLTTKIDPRRVIFFGVAMLGVMTLARTGGTPQMTFWQIAGWLLLSGACLPMFFMPTTVLALSSVDEAETASASGLMNFIRTLAGAVAVSLVNTGWEDVADKNHGELVGAMRNSGEAVSVLQGGGLNEGQAISVIARMVEGQAVMIAVNQVLLFCAGVFVVAALAIWFAPKPARIADATMAH